MVEFGGIFLRTNWYDIISNKINFVKQVCLEQGCQIQFLEGHCVATTLIKHLNQSNQGLQTKDHCTQSQKFSHVEK